MTKFYLLPFLFFLFSRAVAQDCSALQINYSVTESRCVATGSITITASGGSGTYNYKASGPISTPYTSSNSITGLQAGYYSVYMKDLSSGCIKQVDSVYVPGSYADPRFQLTKTDASCAGNDGTIATSNQQFGRSPFTYTIISPSPSAVGTFNTSGNFTGLTPGEYYIRLQDSCGGIQVRQVTIENYDWWFDVTSVTKIDCSNAHASISIKDNKGNSNTSGTAFNGFIYGVVIGTDTTWSTSNDFDFVLGTARNVTLVAKDDCGNLHTTNWSLPANVKPSIGGIGLSDFTCTNFTATVNNTQNLTSPDYCLYDSDDNLLECNSDGIFTHVLYGSYCIKITDVCYDTTIVKCFVASRPVPAVASNVSISNQNCTSFTATITGQTNLINPNYCLTDTDNNIISCNTDGVFADLPYGSYCIQITNGCSDTTISRCFTATKPVPVLKNYSITGADCSTFNVSITGDSLITPNYCLYDELGNLVTCDSSGNFTGITHGSYCVKAVSCGDTTAALCFTSSRPVPSVGPSVDITNKACTGFTAAITNQLNLTNPQYCLYDSTDVLLYCNTTGVFADIAYGSYCIKIKDSCTDSTIVRCFTQWQAIPSVNATVQQTNSSCTDFSAKVTGTNLTSPLYYVYDVDNNLVASNATGVFDHLPYGSYCFEVHDDCKDTTMRVCKTFSAIRGLTITSAKSCSIGNTNVSVKFANTNGPYQIKIFHPNGLIQYDTLTASNPFQILLPSLPAGTQYKIVGIDACNQKDTIMITPDASIITKSISVRAKCPTGAWINGAGDLQVSCTSNFYTTRPAIIKKDGVAFNKSYSSVASNVYTFADLEPATYIVEYAMQTCNSKLYDTVTVQPYAYPSQGQSAVYQCDNNTLSLSSDVKGGVSPFSYEIFGSLPETPSITTAAQSDPVFSINTGTLYSLVRMRAIDACGNGTLDDVSVLPLQNVSVKASQLCFYQNTTLTVDTIHNATYEWYHKTTPTDSTLVGSGLSYNLPFFVPEEVGQYVCKVNVNNGCLMRFSSFTLDGQCDGIVFLPVSLQLKGKITNGANQLSWIVNEENTIAAYILEKRIGNDNNFQTLESFGVKNFAGNNQYMFTDRQPGSGENWYRIKIVYKNGQTGYSNVVALSVASNARVYPNPVKDQLYINLSSGRAADFTIQLFDLAGRKLYASEQKSITNTTVIYKKEKNINKGMYLLKIINRSTGTVETYKILME